MRVTWEITTAHEDCMQCDNGIEAALADPSARTESSFCWSNDGHDLYLVRQSEKSRGKTTTNQGLSPVEQ